MLNINELALPVINTVVNGDSGIFAFRYFESQEQDEETGFLKPKYGPWYGIIGNVQYVKRDMYQDLGLDFTKVYINAWGSVDIHANAMQNQPDQVFWRGWLWNVTSVNEWNLANGWVNVTAVKDKRYSEGIDRKPR